MRRYCTYFDSNYLARAMVLLDSLKEHEGDFVLHALCLDDQAYEAVSRLQDPHCLPLSLAALESFDGRLPLARENRSLIEYYFTLSPFLPLYLLRTVPGISQITYIDADCCYYSSPQPIYDEMGDASILIIEHRFLKEQQHLSCFGRFNVGLLVFCNTSEGLACLERWGAQCAEWCYDRLEDEKFADQKYLDEWPGLYKNLHILRHPGVNLAPWNISNVSLVRRRNQLIVNDKYLLVMYHFHALRFISHNVYLPTGDQQHLTVQHIKLLYSEYAQKVYSKGDGRVSGYIRYSTINGGRKKHTLLTTRQSLPMHSKLMFIWLIKWMVGGMLEKRKNCIEKILVNHCRPFCDYENARNKRYVVFSKIRQHPTILFNRQILIVLVRSFAEI